MMPRYTSSEHNRIVRVVWIDGEDVTRVTVTADTDEGWVDYIYQEDDEWVFNDDGTLATKRRHGKVKVILRERKTLSVQKEQFVRAFNKFLDEQGVEFVLREWEYDNGYTVDFVGEDFLIEADELDSYRHMT